MKGYIPENKYYHDPEMKNNEGHTVCYYLWDNSIKVPEEWKDN